MRATSTRACGSAYRKSSKAWRSSSRFSSACLRGRSSALCRKNPTKGPRWSRAFAAISSPGCASVPVAGSSALICATRRGSSGLSWKPRSRATSLPTSRSATSRSTARIQAMTFKLLLKNLVRGPLTEPAPALDGTALAEQVNQAARERLGRSLSIREVDAGSCNGCELEIHALNNVLYDLERFGLRFVASPRHADLLLVTGPVTRNMREALERTYEATPGPKWVVAVGDCARNGGVFAGSPACVGGVSQVVPVDLHIAGCPPSPEALLKGLLALLQSVSS